MKRFHWSLVILTMFICIVRPYHPRDARAFSTCSFLDGEIIFSGLDRNIYRMNADGSNIRMFLHSDIFRGEPQWSPDWSKIAFQSSRDENHIYIMDADGSGVRELVAVSNFSGNMHWSPDSQKIAYRDDNIIFIIDLSGNILQQTKPYLEESESFHIGEWSPDGKKLAVIFYGDPYPYPDAIAIFDIETNYMAYLTGPYLDYDADFLTWSPDGTEILIARSGEHPFSNLQRIFAERIDGTRSRNVTPIPIPYVSGLQWSPDKTKILFHAISPYSTYIENIYILDWQTGQLTKIITDADDISMEVFSVVWSPDGQKIAFNSILPDPNHKGSEIFKMTPDGEQITRLTNSPEHKWILVWRPCP